jgi:hypothetical protein
MMPSHTGTAVFSTYERAKEFCKHCGLLPTAINGVPLDTGYANISTGEVHNYYPVAQHG